MSSMNRIGGVRMGQCAVCHHEKLPHQSVCPNCQNQILYSKTPSPQSPKQRDAAQSSSSNNNKDHRH